MLDLGGVEGGEGNSMGWMEEGDGGSCLVGEQRGKNTTGLKGETGEKEAWLVGEEDGDISLVGGSLSGHGGGGEAGLEGESEGREGDSVGEGGGKGGSFGVEDGVGEADFEEEGDVDLAGEPGELDGSAGLVEERGE